MPDNQAERFRALDAAARRIADQTHAKVNEATAQAQPMGASARDVAAYLLERVIALLEERF